MKLRFNNVLHLALMSSTLLLLLLLPACYPEFKYPISPPSKLKIDPQILGTWVGESESGRKTQLSIFPRSSEWFDLVYLYDINSETSIDGINWLILEGYSTHIDDENFLCLRFRKKDPDYWNSGDPNEFLFFIINYRVPDKKTFIVKHFSTEKVKAFINNGTLKGSLIEENIFKGRFGDRVIIMSSSDELIQIIHKKGIQALLKEGKYGTMIFHRIDPMENFL